MVLSVSVRRLKPGTWDRFREEWEPKVWPEGTKANWLARNEDDPDIVASITLLDLDEEGLDRVRDSKKWVEAKDERLRRLSEFEEEILTAGFFHVVAEHGPPPPGMTSAG